MIWRWLICAVLLGCSGSADPSTQSNRPAADSGSDDEDAGPYRGQVDAGKPDAGRAPAPKITETEACRLYIAYYCERLLSCGLRDLQSVDACLAGADYCPDFAFSPGSTRTIENVVACGKAWLDQPCEDVSRSRLPACGATPGMRAAGERCITTTQCQSGRCTGYVGADTCGTCIDEVPSGAACNANVVCPYDESCVDGACQRRTLTAAGKSSVVYAPGQVCERSTDPSNGGCSMGTACFAAAPGEPNRCNYLPGPGERCDAGLCWGGGLCMQTCAPVYACPANGMSCTRGNVCVCRDAKCSWQACAALRQEGQSCGLPATPCADRLECVEGVCKRQNLPSRYDELCK